MKKRIIAGVMVLVFMSLALMGCSNEVVLEEQEEKSVSVETTVSELRDISLNTTITGAFRASDTVDVVPKVMGKVTSLNVKEGQRVSKNQVLFTIDSQNVASAVRNAESAIKSAEAAVESAQASFRRTQEQHENALVNLERTKQLYEAGAVPLNQLEQAELGASDVNIEIANSQVFQAQVSLENARAALLDAQTGLADYTVRAPIAGVITRLNITQGNVASGGPSLTISNLDSLIMDSNIPENLINYFKVGDQIQIRVRSASDAILTGTVQVILPPNQGSLTYPLEIKVNNAPSEVMAGMFGEISIATQVSSNTVTIPSSAVTIKDGQSVVFTTEGDRAKMQVVETGLDDGEYIEILSGIEVGETIISKGQNFLDDGTKIIIVSQGGN